MKFLDEKNSEEETKNKKQKYDFKKILSMRKENYLENLEENQVYDFQMKNDEEVKEEVKEKEVKEEKQENIQIKKIKIITNKNNIKIILISTLIMILSGLIYLKVNDNAPKMLLERTDIVIETAKDRIYIYYPDDNQLKSEEIEVLKLKNTTEIIDKTIEEVIKKLEILMIIPDIEKDRDVFFYEVENKIYLDIPEKTFELVKTPREELLIIYSFINSLTNVANIESIKILIDGRDIDKVKYANLKKYYTYIKSI